MAQVQMNANVTFMSVGCVNNQMRANTFTTRLQNVYIVFSLLHCPQVKKSINADSSYLRYYNANVI